MCCSERELVNEAIFANTPFFFTFEGCVSSVTDIVSQNSDWQRVKYLHHADEEVLKVNGEVRPRG